MTTEWKGMLDESPSAERSDNTRLAGDVVPLPIKPGPNAGSNIGGIDSQQERIRNSPTNVAKRGIANQATKEDYWRRNGL